MFMEEEKCCCHHKTKERSEKEYKDLIHRLNRENPGASQRMFTAILNGTFPDWPA